MVGKKLYTKDNLCAIYDPCISVRIKESRDYVAKQLLDIIEEEKLEYCIMPHNDSFIILRGNTNDSFTHSKEINITSYVQALKNYVIEDCEYWKELISKEEGQGLNFLGENLSNLVIRASCRGNSVYLRQLVKVSCETGGIDVTYINTPGREYDWKVIMFYSKQ
jgi:hypothetical protein